MENHAINNPNAQFIIDNYDVLCIAHRNRAVLVMDRKVVRTFDSMFDALAFINCVNISDGQYAIKECDGGQPEKHLLTYPIQP